MADDGHGDYPSILGILSESIQTTFDNEVWIEIENSMETIISQVFTEGDQLNLEVLKEDEIFITSGNMGLISIKVDDNQKQFLGSMGEIGRKRIF